MATINLKANNLENRELPFRVQLSFHNLFKHWEELANSENEGEAAYGRDVLARLAHASELRQPILDNDLLSKYESEIELLMSAIFPSALKTNEIKAVGIPFTPVLF
ncbi:MAG: hypothetical protein AAFV25_27925, partial [Bacteroidota bacterium]